MKKEQGNWCKPSAFAPFLYDSLINSCDFSAESVEAFVYVFVASVNLLNVADGACAFGAERRDKQGDTRSDVWRTHVKIGRAHV